MDERWAPFHIDKKYESRIESHLVQNEVIDFDLAMHAVQIIDSLTEKTAQTIVDREGLPHIAHLICGWGNLSVGGRYLFDRIYDFARATSVGLIIPQNNLSGDFHPWQTFAYGCMSDSNFFNYSRNNVTLLEVAQASNNLNSCDTTDLGHFLYASSYIPLRLRSNNFVFGGREATIVELANMALNAHVNGGFHVCRKFHLTEGLCAISRQMHSKKFRKQVAVLLSGQLKSLIVLNAIVKTMESILCSSKNSLMDELEQLRRILVLGGAIENIYYYAGHLVELAAISNMYGYDEADGHASTIACILNFLNKLLPSISCEIHYEESFYAFAHYRRGYLLYTKSLTEVGGRGEGVKFISRSNGGGFSFPEAGSQYKWPFTFASAKIKPSNKFSLILDNYNKIAVPEHMARGEFAHFRKIMPCELPLGVHYEFLCTANSIGLEIHCERDEHTAHREYRVISETLCLRAGVAAIFDPDWYGGCGRVVVRYSWETPPSTVAKAMNLIIKISLPMLIEVYSKCNV